MTDEAFLFFWRRLCGQVSGVWSDGGALQIRSIHPEKRTTTGQLCERPHAPLHAFCIWKSALNCSMLSGSNFSPPACPNRPCGLAEASHAREGTHRPPWPWSAPRTGSSRSWGQDLAHPPGVSCSQPRPAQDQTAHELSFSGPSVQQRLSKLQNFSMSMWRNTCPSAFWSGGRPGWGHSIFPPKATLIDGHDVPRRRRRHAVAEMSTEAHTSMNGNILDDLCLLVVWVGRQGCQDRGTINLPKLPCPSAGVAGAAMASTGERWVVTQAYS